MGSATVHEQVISRLHSIPAVVAVHRPPTAGDGCHARVLRVGAPALDRLEEAGARARRGIAPVGEQCTTSSGVLSSRAIAISSRKCARLEWTPPSEARPSRWQLRRAQRSTQDRVRGELAARGGVVDTRQVLERYGPGANREVADLRVAHLPLGQP